jgi:proteasome lid subunit RPN8/RPN11
MVVRLNSMSLEHIRSHGARDYPNECCGILFGRVEGDVKQVVEALPLKNLRTEPEKAQEVLPLEAPSSCAPRRTPVREGWT